MPIVQVERRQRFDVADDIGFAGCEWFLELNFDLDAQQATTIDILDILVTLDGELDAIFQGVFDEENKREELSPHDVVHLEIAFEAGGENFYVNCRLAENPVQRLFNGIERVLQSSKELLFGRWYVRLTILRAPVGMGGRFANFSIATNFFKQSVVEINNSDSLCLWRAVVVLLAFEHRQQGLELAKQAGLDKSSPEVKRLKSEYARVRRWTDRGEQFQVRAAA